MTKTVYIALLDEGVDSWRPVEAESMGDNLYRIPGSVPAEECWEFRPGMVVFCQERQLSGGLTLVAVHAAKQ